MCFLFQVNGLPTKKGRSSASLFGGLFLEVSNNVSAFSGLLEAGESHLGTLDVLFGVLEVFKEGLIRPDDTRVLVGIRVLVVREGTSSTSKETIQVGTLLVGRALCSINQQTVREGGKLELIFVFFSRQRYFRTGDKRTEVLHGWTPVVIRFAKNLGTYLGDSVALSAASLEELLSFSAVSSEKSFVCH